MGLFTLRAGVSVPCGLMHKNLEGGSLR